MYECTNCDYKGEILSKYPLRNKCPKCGDEVLGFTEQKDKEEELNLDLNNDGVIDSKDAVIASKVMNAVKRKKKSSKKKVKR